MICYLGPISYTITYMKNPEQSIFETKTDKNGFPEKAPITREYLLETLKNLPEGTVIMVNGKQIDHISMGNPLNIVSKEE